MVLSEKELKLMGLSQKDIDSMPSVMWIDDKDMDEWKAICKKFAEKLGAELLYVNNTGCGLQFPDESMGKYSVERMMEILEDEEKSKNTRSDEER